MYSTVATIQNPIAVQVAIAMESLKWRAIKDMTLRIKVTYEKNKVTDGLLVSDECAKGKRIPSDDQNLSLSLIDCRI